MVFEAINELLMTVEARVADFALLLPAPEDLLGTVAAGAEDVKVCVEVWTTSTFDGTTLDRLRESFEAAEVEAS